VKHDPTMTRLGDLARVWLTSGRRPEGVGLLSTSQAITVALAAAKVTSPVIRQYGLERSWRRLNAPQREFVQEINPTIYSDLAKRFGESVDYL